MARLRSKGYQPTDSLFQQPDSLLQQLKRGNIPWPPKDPQKFMAQLA